MINYHDFSVFLHEQPHLEDYFRSIFNVTKRNVTFNGVTITANDNTFIRPAHGSDTYRTIPFDTIDPEVYKTRTARNIEKMGRPEKWTSYTRAYWCITCGYCGKEVRFCSMCQGELLPVDRKADEDKTVRKMQCTEVTVIVACDVVSPHDLAALLHKLRASVQGGGDRRAHGDSGSEREGEGEMRV